MGSCSSSVEVEEYPSIPEKTVVVNLPDLTKFVMKNGQLTESSRLKLQRLRVHSTESSEDSDSHIPPQQVVAKIRAKKQHQTVDDGNKLKTNFKIPRKRLNSSYRIKQRLGNGHFAQVRLAMHRSTGKEYAIKFLRRKEMQDLKVVKREIDCLTKVGAHPNVVQLVEYFQDRSGIYLVLDYCSGGDLFSRIIKEGKCSERQAAVYCAQLALGLKHMHDQGVVHRDLKPENIMLANSEANSPLKITDFGLSKIVSDEARTKADLMGTCCGTWAYAAPEVIKLRGTSKSDRTLYSSKCDNWSLGVLMFILLSGYHPFDEFGEAVDVLIIGRILNNKWDFNDACWESISDEALLNVNAEERMSLDDYLSSDWIQGALEEVSNSSSKYDIRVWSRLEEYATKRKNVRKLQLAKLADKRRHDILKDKKPTTTSDAINNNSADDEKNEFYGTPAQSPRAKVNTAAVFFNQMKNVDSTSSIVSANQFFYGTPAGSQNSIIQGKDGLSRDSSEQSNLSSTTQVRVRKASNDSQQSNYSEVHSPKVHKNSRSIKLNQNDVSPRNAANMAAQHILMHRMGKKARGHGNSASKHRRAKSQFSQSVPSTPKSKFAGADGN